jgi:hypothetical protein
MASDDKGMPQGGGLNEEALRPATGEPLGGTGGSAGGGTIAGSGEPSGAAADRDDAGSDGPPVESLGEVAGQSDDRIAAEAAALGSADGSIADAAGVGGTLDATLGDAIGALAGRDVGSGTPGDKGDLGGGGRGA